MCGGGAQHASEEARELAARVEIEAIQPEMAYLDVIREVLPRDGFFVEELCQAGFTSYYGFPVYEPRTYVTAGFQGTLGFGFPTAIGVKAAMPDRAVVSITGDGGFMFGMPELATAVQQHAYEGRLIRADLRSPDFGLKR